MLMYSWPFIKKACFEHSNLFKVNGSELYFFFIPQSFLLKNKKKEESRNKTFQINPKVLTLLTNLKGMLG